MKFIRIFLAVLIFIGIGLLVTQKFWVPKLVAEILQHETSFVPVDTLDKGMCHETQKYFAIENSLADSVGTNILVKYKTTANQHFACSYTVGKNDFEIKNGDADYFLAFTDNFLVIDRGTAPDPRGLIVYDLRSRTQVYADRYSKPWSVAGDTITYWNPTDTKATTQNCPKLAEYTSQGLGALIESRVTLDLSTLTKKASGEYRCSVTQ